MKTRAPYILRWLKRAYKNKADYTIQIRKEPASCLLDAHYHRAVMRVLCAFLFLSNLRTQFILLSVVFVRHRVMFFVDEYFSSYSGSHNGIFTYANSWDFMWSIAYIFFSRSSVHKRCEADVYNGCVNLISRKDVRDLISIFVNLS